MLAIQRTTFLVIFAQPLPSSRNVPPSDCYQQGSPQPSFLGVLFLALRLGPPFFHGLLAVTGNRRSYQELTHVHGLFLQHFFHGVLKLGF